jgi:N-acetylglucosamine-6-phosphate deacetylase
MTAPRVITADPAGGVLAPGYVTVAAGRVTAVEPGSPPRRPDIELPDGVLLPGFVDLQVNGYYGEEFPGSPEGLAMVVTRLPETGTTAVLPTFVTSPPCRAGPPGCSACTPRARSYPRCARAPITRPG